MPNDIIGKVYLFDGTQAYDKMTLHKKDVKIITDMSLEDAKELAKKEKKHVALVSEHFKFFIERS